MICMAAAPKVTLPNRDEVTTIRADGSRRFLHPADARGRFMRARRWSGWLLVVVYLALPWIKAGGYPALFLDVAERRFHFFGGTLAAQDMWLLFFLIAGLGFTLFLVTALLGRVWCGWACPQTVFLEHVYRRIERWIEGDAVRRRKLAAAPWTAGKVCKLALKHGLFAMFSAAIAHLFLAYFVSIPKLWGMMAVAPVAHWGAFLFIVAFSGILYFNFAWFREQLCIIICPYGRIQSALIDDHSMVIGYDAARGEPRGRAGTEGAGDCIDCHRCVQVCPTGIDIRQGLQIECIGCAACIDACGEVMGRLKRPRGLVRYDSLNGFAGKATRWLRPRTLVYALIMGAGATAAAAAFLSVKPAFIGVTRMVGSAYVMDAGTVRNQYFVRLVNKAGGAVRFTVTVEGLPAGAIVNGFEAPVPIAADGEEQRPLIVRMPLADYTGGFPVRIRVRDESGRVDLSRETKFVGPDPLFLKMTLKPVAPAPASGAADATPPPAAKE
jgi:cytochrome c oxidase accessory protein FixG